MNFTRSVWSLKLLRLTAHKPEVTENLIFLNLNLRILFHDSKKDEIKKLVQLTQLNIINKLLNARLT